MKHNIGTINLNIDNLYEDIKQLLTSGLAIAAIGGASFVPYVNLVLGPLLFILTPQPNKTNVWDEIRLQVEQLIQEKIDDAVYSLQKAKVEGLADKITYFNTVLKDAPGDFEAIRRNVTDVHGSFVAALAELRNTQFAVVSLPMYASAATLYAIFMRLVIGQGRNWEIKDGEYKTLFDEAQRFFTECDQYMLATAEKWREKALNAAPTEDNRYPLRYNYLNETESNIVTLVDDFRIIIKYANPISYPNEVTIPPEDFSDIFSNAYGTHSHNHINDASIYTNPLANMEKIHIGFFNHHAVNLDCYYPEGKGPLHGKVRTDVTTPLGGDWSSAVEQTDFTIPAPPSGQRYSLAGVTVGFGDIVESLTLLPISANPIKLFANTGGGLADVRVHGRKLSTISATSRSNFTPYHNAISMMIFGFSRDYPTETSSVRSARYIAGDDTVDISDLSPDIINERESYQRYLRK